MGRGGEGGGRGGGGVMTSMRMRFCVVFLLLFCVLCIGGEGGGDGCISHWFLRCFPTISGQHCAHPRLVAHASLEFHVYVFDLRAGVGRGGDGGG